MYKFDENEAPVIDLGNGHVVRLEPEELNKKDRDKAEKELRENEEIRTAAIKEFIILMSEEKGLFVPLDNEMFALRYLRPCHFYPESALQKLQKFYRFKQKNPKYTKDLFPRTVRHVFEADIVQLNPERTQNGCRMVMINTSKWKTNEVHVDDIFRAIEVCVEAATREPSTQVNGVVVMFDVEVLSLTHFMQISPMFAAALAFWVQECIPMRVKEVHMVYNSRIFSMIFNIFKPFLNAKIRSRIHFHGKDMDSLHKFIDPEGLRPRYKGTLDCADVDGKFMADLFEFYNKEYELEYSYGYTK